MLPSFGGALCRRKWYGLHRRAANYLRSNVKTIKISVGISHNLDLVSAFDKYFKAIYIL